MIWRSQAVRLQLFIAAMSAKTEVLPTIDEEAIRARQRRSAIINLPYWAMLILLAGIFLVYNFIANETYSAAVEAFNAGNYADALTRANEVLETLADTPDNREAYAYVYALMGAAYSRQLMFDEAVDAFTRRLEYAATGDAQAHLDLAQALAESGNQEAARPHFEAALQLDPDDAATQYNVGVTMVEAGDVEGGIARMERAIELQPVYPLAHKNLGFAYARTEQYAKAVAAFERYLEQAPGAEDAAEIRDFVVALKEMIG